VKLQPFSDDRLRMHDRNARHFRGTGRCGSRTCLAKVENDNAVVSVCCLQSLLVNATQKSDLHIDGYCSLRAIAVV